MPEKSYVKRELRRARSEDGAGHSARAIEVCVKLVETGARGQDTGRRAIYSRYPFPPTEIWMRDAMAVGPVRRLPTTPLRSPGSSPWVPGFV